MAELEGQVESLKLSLETLQSEIETKNSQAIELESSKAALEVTFQKSKDELTRLQAEYDESKSALISLKEEVRSHSGIYFLRLTSWYSLWLQPPHPVNSTQN